MGKMLERYAVGVLAERLLQGNELFSLETKAKRKKIFDAVSATSTFGGDNEEHDWQIFRLSMPPNPDGILLSAEKKTVVFLEIEDTCPLSESRIDQYVVAKQCLASHGWQTMVYVANRYGMNEHLLDIERWRKLRVSS